MFEYYKGYEIDGSDTCYNIITPEVEKIKELVNYYLNLKIIDKNTPITIYSVNGKKKHSLVGKYYNKHELNRLWEDVSGNKFFEISYKYVDPNSLYPEVKRELIDFIVNNSNIKESDLVMPVFLDNRANIGYMNIILDSGKAKKNHFDIEGIYSKKYQETIIKNPFYSLQIDCILGCSGPLKYYAIKKMSLTFPEYGIDSEESIGDISFCEGDIERFIFEQIIIESNDFEYTIHKILDNKNIEFNNKEKHLELANSRYIYKLEEKLKFEYIDVNDKEKSFSNYDEDKRKDVIFDIYNKYFDNTVKGYVRYVQKLSELDFINNKDYEVYTKVSLSVKSSQGNYNLSMFFQRKNNDLRMAAIVPQKMRRYTEEICSVAY